MACGRYDAIAQQADRPGSRRHTGHPHRLRGHVGPEELRARDWPRGACVGAGLVAQSVRQLGAKGFLTPATAELQSNPEGFGGFNRNLTFATSTGEEIGARGLLPHALSYEVAAFHLETKNDIGRYRVKPRAVVGVDFYRNVGDTRRYGVETRLGWQPVRKLSMDVAYTWSQFKYVSPAAIDGHWLPNSPEHMLNLGVDYQVVPQLSVGIESEMQSHWWVDTDGLASVPGFALWGANASYRWHMGEPGGELKLRRAEHLRRLVHGLHRAGLR